MPTQATLSPTEQQVRDQASQAMQEEHNQHSNDSERALCGCVMRDRAQGDNLALRAKLFALLSPEDFFAPQHQTIWQIAARLHAAGMETSPLTVADAATRQGDFIGGAGYLVSILDDPLCRAATDEALEAAAQRVKGLALLRRLESSLQQARLLCSRQDFATVASFIEDDVANLRRAASTSRSTARPISDYIATVLARIEAAADGQNANDGIPTGFENLDAITSGLMPETLTVLAARPAMGKTAFALNIARNVACQMARPVLIFSLEMTGASLAQRTLATDGRISLHRLKRGDLDQDEWSRLADSVEALKDAPIYIDEAPGLTLSSIRARAREFQQRHPQGVLMLDYLQIVAMDKHQRDKFAHVGEVSRGLKELARELQIPVVALAQLSRDLERRANKRPMMSDLRESGQIEQDAEVILFLYRDEVYNPDTPDKGITEVIVGKNRDGRTDTVRMAFHGELMQFSELGVVGNE